MTNNSISYLLWLMAVLTEARIAGWNLGIGSKNENYKRINYKI
jgi:hypothetical protein